MLCLRLSLFPQGRLASLLRVTAVGGAFAAAAACGNISLTNTSESVPSGSGGYEVPDAAVDASLPISSPDGANAGGGLPAADAGVATGSTASTNGDPLCNYSFAPDGGVHVCEPDTSKECAESADSGAYSPPALDDGGDGAAPLSACHVVPSGQTCGAAGPGGDGAQCQTGADCAESFECVGSPGQCRHYCCGGNATCDGDSNVTMGSTFCDVQTTASAGLYVPVCEPVTRCTLLLAGTCPQGETCAVVKDDGTTSCVAIGNVGIGRSCNQYHCAAELTCLGAVGSRTCFQLCEVDAPVCPNGMTCMSSAQLFANANVGICR
jgi:hypothetical protein